MARDEYDDRDDRDSDRYEDRPRRGDRDDSPDDLIATAKRKAKPPAICLIIIGVIYLGCCIWSMVATLVFFDQQWDQAIAQQQTQQQGNPQAAQAAQQMMKDMKPVVQVATLAVAAVFALLAVLIIFGASRMLTVSSRGWGMAAGIIALFPLNCYAWVFGIAFGIWSIVVLCNPEVKRGFAAKRGGPTADRDEHDRRDDRDRDDDRR